MPQPLASSAPVVDPDEEASEPPVDIPDDLTIAADALRDLPSLEIPASLGRRSRLDLQTMIDSLPGSRIPQAVYLRSVLFKVPGPWAGKSDSTDSVALDPGDLPLVIEDMGNLLREWTGHDFAGDSAALLAEILACSKAEIVALGRGKAQWFVKFSQDERVRRFLGFNEHEGSTWLNREALETLLTAMVVCEMTSPAKPRLVSLLDGRAIIVEAAEEAGYAVDGMLDILSGK